MSAQSKSLDEVAALAIEYEDRLEDSSDSTPSSGRHEAMESGWGYRIHPIKSGNSILEWISVPLKD